MMQKDTEPKSLTRQPLFDPRKVNATFAEFVMSRMLPVAVVFHITGICFYMTASAFLHFVGLGIGFLIMLIAYSTVYFRDRQLGITNRTVVIGVLGNLAGLLLNAVFLSLSL